MEELDQAKTSSQQVNHEFFRAGLAMGQEDDILACRLSLCYRCAGAGVECESWG